MAEAKLHTQKWAYRYLYSDGIFNLCTRLYPFLKRGGFHAVSRTVAWSYAVTQPSVRKVVRDNLQLLTKEPMTDRDAIRVFSNFAATIADYVAVGAMPTAQALDLCENRLDGLGSLLAATQSGQGVILATAHYSFFEFGAVITNSMGVPLTIATLSEPTTELTEWRAQWRQRWNTGTVEVGADPFSSVQVIRSLQEGRSVAMLIDRPIPEHGLPVDLPNGRIPFSTSPAVLASMTGCPIVPVIIRRLPNGRYQAIAKPPIAVQRARRENRKEEIERCTRLVAESLMEEIYVAPHQWYQFVPVGL